MTFSEKLFKLRKESGLSQEELAAKVGVSRQAVSRWEAEAVLPDAQNLITLSRIFGVSIDYLLCEEMQYRKEKIDAKGAGHSVRSFYCDRLIKALGQCVLLVGSVGLIGLGIAARYHPATYVDSTGSWSNRKIYEGFWGFLKCYDLEWLFGGCIAFLCAGTCIALWPKVRAVICKWLYSKRPKDEA